MPLQVLDQVALTLVPLLLDVTIKGGVLLLLAALLAVVLRRASAARLHLLWTLALASLVCLPAVSLLLPSWNLPLHVEEAQATAPPAGAPGVLVQLAQLPRQTPSSDRPLVVWIGELTPQERLAAEGGQNSTPQPASDQSAAVPWLTPRVLCRALLLLWLAGLVLAGLRLTMGWLRLRRLRHSCRPIESGGLVEQLHRVRDRAGIRRPILLVKGRPRVMPMTWGMWQPAVLLPADADRWPAERVRMVLQHEVAHIARWDCLTQLLAHLVRALLWFHPLVWLGVARLRLEQERACDDVVVRDGAASADYAEHLLVVSAGLPPGFLLSTVALAMSRAAFLQRRLGALLDQRQRRQPVTGGFAGLAALLGLCLLIPLATLGGQATVSAGEKEQEKKPAAQSADSAEVRRVAEVQKKVLENNLKKVDPAKLAEGAIMGMIATLKDPYAAYYTAEEVKEFERQTTANFVGIGIQIRLEGKKIVVTSPLQNSPALKAGIRPGDVINTIDGKAAEGIPLQKAVQLILGKAGTAVKLEVTHTDGTTDKLTITRGPLRLGTVQGFRRGDGDRWVYLLDAKNKIGYLQIIQFGSKTASEVEAAVEGLKKDGLNGLIVDLRYCPGGLLNQSVATSDLFLSEGTIVTIKGTKGEKQVFMADARTLGKFPMIVLINGQTASAAEIMAGALKDNNRAVLLGTRTFGKGSVQSILSVEGGGALKLTVALHYLPSGRNIQKHPGDVRWGVDPDDGFYIPMTHEQVDALAKRLQMRGVVGLKDRPKVQPITPEALTQFYGDPQLGAALTAMRAKIDKGEFLKVGRPLKDLTDQISRLEDLRQQQKKLQQALQNLNQEVQGLERVVDGVKGQKN
jgi:carboxyl-terminal processing protease